MFLSFFGVGSFFFFYFEVILERDVNATEERMELRENTSTEKPHCERIHSSSFFSASGCNRSLMRTENFFFLLPRCIKAFLNETFLFPRYQSR